jgi:AcrR family transcriptional regulator
MVASAAALLRRHGVQGTSFARVLEHSGAPRGSIGHHFPGGKREMILAAVTAAGEEITGLLATAAEHGASAAELVDAACGYFIDGLERTDHRAGCPVAATANEAFDDDTLRIAAGDAIGEWVDLLAATLRDEGHPPDRADELAQLMVAAIEGALMMSRVQRSTSPLESVRVQLRQLLSAAPSSH